MRNVTVRRESQRALDRINLKIETGEHVALLGPNGCGKSTLIHTLTRECYPYLLDGDDWSLRILGRDRWDIFELRSMMGIVNNDLMLACRRDYTAREVILSGFFSSIGVWPNHEVTPAMLEKVEEMLELLEIPHLADRAVFETSSGEGRRVLIGRALVNEPAALVLDEPSTSLDLRAMRELRDILRKIAARGTSLILVTHHVDEIIPEIERVVLMRGGRVVKDGAKHEILTSTNLSELFDVPGLELAEREGYFNCW
ncbi:MAG TPA: ATP-binding cassette domain-containing protein [Bryobacteraceae bacterium]